MNNLKSKIYWTYVGFCMLLCAYSMHLIFTTELKYEIVKESKTLVDTVGKKAEKFFVDDEDKIKEEN